MTTNNAYILGVLNSAVYFEDKKVKILYGDSSVISQLDGYVWSQLCAIKPEYREVKFSSIEKLLEETNDESKKHEALELSLELMDTTLSHDYRLGVSKILGELLNSDDKLVSFTLNRLYSTPLPEKFSANQAFELLMPKFSRAGDFYLDLESKTTFFSYFYTLFKLELELEFQKQDLLDQVLTDSGCYAKFTIALYETSKKKYDSVSFEILKHLKEFHIPHSPNIFFEIEHRLRYDYNVLLNGKAIQVSILEKESKPTEESDEILHLIENHYITKQSEHDTKKSKRGKAKRVEPSFGDMRDVVEALKDWAKNYAYRGDEAFLHEFKNVVAKQLKYSKPEQLCKTCCDLASYFTQKNRFNLSKKLLKYAKRLNSEDNVIYSQEAELYNKSGDLQKALALYNLAIQKFGNDAVDYCGKAETFRDMGKFNDALKLYEEAIQRFGDNVVPYCGKAETFRDMGKLDDALKLYEEAIQRFSDNIFVYNGKAETFRNMGKLDDALKLYEEAIQRFSDNIFAYNGKAETFRDMGKFDDALKLYEETIQRFGDNVVAYNGKAETFRDMGKFEDALKLYEETIQRFGDNVFAYNGKAETFRDMGKLDDALKFYEETIQRFGDNVVAYNGKAETFRGMGRLDEALQQYDDNLQRNSKNRIAETGRLKLLLETNQLEKHLNILVKSKYETFDDYFNLHIYSMFLIKKGDWDKALKLINLGLKSPFFQNKLYFKGLASFLKILQKEYTIALSYFNPNEANKPIENLLATHAFAATNQIGQAKIVLHKLDHIEIPVIKTTLSYLSERYILNGFKKSDKSDDELDALIIEGEMKALLQF